MRRLAILVLALATGCAITVPYAIRSGVNEATFFRARYVERCVTVRTPGVPCTAWAVAQRRLDAAQLEAAEALRIGVAETTGGRAQARARRRPKGVLTMGNPITDAAAGAGAVATALDHAAERREASDGRLVAQSERTGGPLPDPAPEPEPEGFLRYVPADATAPLPALVLAVHGDGTADLLVFPGGVPVIDGEVFVSFVTSVPHSDSNAPRSWHWPPLT